VPDFKGDVTQLDNYNGYSLSVISPIKQIKKGKFSSALMSSVLHLLLIADDLTN